MNSLAAALIKLVTELDREAKSDAELAELIVPHLLRPLCVALGGCRRVFTLLERERPRAEHVENVPARVPCAHLMCSYPAVSRRFDPRTGIHRPVCEVHVRGAGPLERLPLETR
jgi:hypothetical protein